MAIRRKRNSKVVRNDGFANAFISRGISQYKKNNSFFNEQTLGFHELTQLWRNPLARKIAKLPAQAALKKGFVIEGDEEKNNIMQALDAIHARSKLIEALTWARFYGRACIFMLMDDGGLEDEPVNYDRLRSIKELMVFDAQCIQEDFSGYLINDDINDENYGKPEWYMITPPLTGKTLYVHHSRLLMFDGEPIPEYERIARNGVGYSCMDGVVKALYRVDTGHSNALNVLERISTSLIKFDGLADILATEGGDEEVQKRLDLIDMARNILNSIALSKEDDYQTFNIPVSGIENLLDSFAQFLCAESAIPYSLLFGRKQGGMTASAESDLETWYGSVSGIQEEQLGPALEKLVKTIQLCKDGPTHGKELKDWTIKYNPLWEPTEKEKAETERINAETKKNIIDSVCALLDRQLMSPEEANKYLSEQLDLPLSLSPAILDLGDDDEEQTEPPK